MKDVFLLARLDGPQDTPVPTGEVFIQPSVAAELRDIRNKIPEGATHIVLSGRLFEEGDPL